MAKIEGTMECIDALIEKMLSNGLSVISVREGDFEITLERAQAVPFACQAPVPTAAAVPAVMVSAPASNGNVVKAPIVGTYYSAPSPNDSPFVRIGQTVKKGDILFIIESMKVMNEIKSEFDGTVITINVKDGEAVEFDQPVMIIS